MQRKLRATDVKVQREMSEKSEGGGMGGGEDHLIQRFNCLALPKHFD